jgi:ribonuclease HII
LPAQPTLELEHSLLENCAWVVGVDEVGRGALAGPVTVGAVLVDASVGDVPAGLADSKALCAAERCALVEPVRRWAVRSALGWASAKQVDQFGVVEALRLAAWQALRALDQPDCVVLLDGPHDYLTVVPDLFQAADRSNMVDQPPFVRVVTQVRADFGCATVAGAAVLAKVARDQHMIKLAQQHPGYAWERNMGYGTAEHRQALRLLGSTAQHRLTWRLT